MAKKKNKTPSFNEICAEEKSKNPRISSDNIPTPVRSQKPSWQIALMDFEGKWGWRNVDIEQLKSIQDRLKNFESMTWGEIEGKKTSKGSQQNHVMAVKRICKDARDRLAEIQLDDIDSLYSLRISGAKRLWGIREDGVLKLLWWDPMHSIYPVDP